MYIFDFSLTEAFVWSYFFPDLFLIPHAFRISCKTAV